MIIIRLWYLHCNSSCFVSCARSSILWGATPHISHIGIFFVPWEPNDWEVWPWCEDVFTRDHSFCSCSGLSEERLVLLRGDNPDRIGDLKRLTNHFWFLDWIVYLVSWAVAQVGWSFIGGAGTLETLGTLTCLAWWVGTSGVPLLFLLSLMRVDTVIFAYVLCGLDMTLMQICYNLSIGNSK